MEWIHSPSMTPPTFIATDPNIKVNGKMLRYKIEELARGFQVYASENVKYLHDIPVCHTLDEAKAHVDNLRKKLINERIKL